MRTKNKFKVKTANARYYFSRSRYWNGTVVRRFRPFVLSPHERIPMVFESFKEATKAWEPEKFEELFNLLMEINSLAEYTWKWEKKKESKTHHKRQLLSKVDEVEILLGRKLNWMNNTYPFYAQKYRDDLEKADQDKNKPEQVEES